MGTLLAVEGCIIKALTAPLSLASWTFVTPASAKVKAENKGIYRGPTDVNCVVYHSGYSVPGVNPVVTIPPTVIKNVTVDTLVPLAKGDKVTVSMLFAGGPSGSTTTASVTIEIDDPGQTSVEGV